MSTETPVVTDTAAVAKTKKTAAPKAKPAAKADKKSKPESTGPRTRAMAKVPAAERRQALLKLMRKLGADKSTNAVPISKLADKLGYSHYDVYCLGYHKFPLAVGGYLKSVKIEGQPEMSLYLTAKGMKSGPDDVK